MDDEEKVTFGEKVSRFCTPAGRCLKTFPRVKEYFFLAANVFIGMGILSLVQLKSIQDHLCTISPDGPGVVETSETKYQNI